MIEGKKKKEEDQLELNIKHSPLNFIAKYKERFEISRARWDVKRYTKSSWVLFNIVVAIFLIITQITTIQEGFPKLPNKIPLLQIYIDATSVLTSKEYIYLMPSFSIFLLIFGIILSNKFYNKERTLSNTLLWSMLLSLFIITISLIRLTNLY